jgi:hypothetical protein
VNVRNAVGIALDGDRCGEAIDDERTVELGKVIAHLGSDVTALEKEADDGEEEEHEEDHTCDLEPADARRWNAGGRLVFPMEVVELIVADGCGRVVQVGRYVVVFGDHGLGQV